MVKFKVLPNILSVNQKATVNVRKHFCPNKIHMSFHVQSTKKTYLFCSFYFDLWSIQQSIAREPKDTLGMKNNVCTFIYNAFEETVCS